MLPLTRFLARSLEFARSLWLPAAMGGGVATATSWLFQVAEPLSVASFSGAAIGTCVGVLGQWQTKPAQGIRRLTEQLQRIALAPRGEIHEVPITPTSAEATICVGWNVLVQRSRVSDVMGRIDARLQHARQAVESTRPALALAALSDGIALTNAAGSILWHNEAFKAILGADEDESLAELSIGPFIEQRWKVPTTAADSSIESEREQEEQQAFESLLSSDPQPIESPGESELTQALARHQGPFSIDLHRGDRLQDGVLRVSRRPLLQTEHHGKQYVWTLRDITQTLLAQEMRNQFVFTATHELRTPLSNIRAYSETLADNPDASIEEQKEFCNVINSEATRLSRLIDELLNISQMEAGSLNINRHETDLMRLFEDVFESIVAQVEQKQIQFQKSLPAKLPKIPIDKEKLEAVLVNLLGNAIKYTPEQGQVAFTVDHGPTQIEIHVEDSGFGIHEDEIPRLFDKFFRSRDERVRDIPGNGLGLAFVQEIVRLHGGRIDVSSELNRGSKFSVTLPIQQ